MLRAARAAFACALIVLAVTGTARAAGGNYALDGGTASERQAVRSALDASSFPWDVVPQQVRIHITSAMPSEATPGQIWLDPNVLDEGAFSWGIVQHEYAHQVDFLMLNDAARMELNRILGGKSWCWGPGAQLAHDAYGCERFASTLAWSYWSSPDNCLQPQAPGDEAAALPPARFRALLGALLHAPSPDAQLAMLRSFVGKAPNVTRPGPAAATRQELARQRATQGRSAAPGR